MRSLHEDFTPCHRCGWPVDDDAPAQDVEVDGSLRRYHAFCVPLHLRRSTPDPGAEDRSTDGSRRVTVRGGGDAE